MRERECVCFLVVVPVSFDSSNGRFCSYAASQLMFVGMSVKDQSQGFDDDSGSTHLFIEQDDDCTPTSR